MAVEQLITNNIDLWTSTIKKKSATGRGSSKKIELYGIKKLRQLIIELAVRGKLVAQNPTDEPVSDLLKLIGAEKAGLIKDKKIKKPKAIAAEFDQPYVLPDTWEFVQLDQIALFTGGFAFKSSQYEEEGTRVIRISDFDERGLINKNIVRYEYTSKHEPFLLAKNDLLMAMTGGTVGKSLLLNEVPEPLLVNQRVAGIRLFIGIEPRYLKYVLQTNLIQGVIEEAKNSTNDNISMGDIRGFLIPLPPTGHQCLLIEKIDELMALCDQLESQTEASLEAHETLVQVLLTALTDSKNAEELNKNWQRVSEYFDTLFTTEQSIDQLKQTILQLAVMGKLVPQNPNDETASVLLEKIAEEKERLIKDKKIKKQRPLPPISDEEKPFELPMGWEFERFSNMFMDLKYGTSQKSDYMIEGAPILRIPNVVSGYVNSSDLKYSKLNDRELEELKLKSGDILIIRSNGSLSIVGTSAVVDSMHSGFAYAGYLVRVRLNQTFNNPYYISLALKSKLVRDQIEKPIRTTSGVKNINSTEISKLILPVVPIDEQNKIVEKVNELMALCEQLKTNINKAQTTQLNLTDAIVDSSI